MFYDLKQTKKNLLQHCNEVYNNICGNLTLIIQILRFTSSISNNKKHKHILNNILPFNKQYYAIDRNQLILMAYQLA